MQCSSRCTAGGVAAADTSTLPPHPSASPAGLQNLALSLGGVLYFGFWRGSLPLGWVYDNYVPLITASVLFSAALSAYLYAASFAKGALLAAGGSTGYRLYDFFMGRVGFGRRLLS